MSGFGKGPASAAAAIGTQAWQVAVDRQRRAAPDHGEFYAVAAELVATLHALWSLTSLLRLQVERYGEGRHLRDDSGMVDPAVRLEAAAADLRATAQKLMSADEAANRFWSAIGHIAVEERP